MIKKVIACLFGICVVLSLCILIILKKDSDRKYNSLKDTMHEQTEFVDNILFSLIEIRNEEEKQILKLSIDNKCGNEILYGDFYILEILIKDSWYEIYKPDSWYNIGYILEDESSSEVEISICNYNYPTLSNGTYRVIKDITILEDQIYNEYFIVANFDIK